MKDSSQPLSRLPVGTRARIASYLSNDAAFRRFREMGMLPGSEIRIVRLAPLGDPIEITVGASLLSLRREQAEMIAVIPEQESVTRP
ncbi:MAG: ferrous iron transport protein A [Verrucomicrobiae bacterium]|nr:ferrous iron transport protein A [Verrucomicrobiae bacterium]